MYGVGPGYTANNTGYLVIVRVKVSCVTTLLPGDRIVSCWFHVHVQPRTGEGAIGTRKDRGMEVERGGGIRTGKEEMEELRDRRVGGRTDRQAG